MEGDCGAIGAVLRVFRRLSHQLPPQTRRRSSPTASDKLRALQTALADEKAAKSAVPDRNQTREELQTLDCAPLTLRAGPPRNSSAPVDLVRPASAPAAAETAQPKAAGSDPTITSKRMKPKQSSHRPRSTTPGRAKRSSSKSAIAPNGHDQPLLGTNRVFRDHQGLHVFGMLDPTAKSQDAGRTTNFSDDCDNAMVRKVCQWLTESLGVDLPFANCVSGESSTPSNRSGHRKENRDKLRECKPVQP